LTGEHRKSVDGGWRTIRLNCIRTEKDRLIARIVASTVRRSVSPKEKTALLTRLGEILLKEGAKPGSIAQKIAKETGMSYRWVMKYLPDNFKDSAQSERDNSATHHAAGRNCKRSVISIELEEPPRDAVAIKAYRNTDFVNTMVTKSLYEQLKEKAKKLETTTDKLIYNAILLFLKSIRD
jgi:hypothetical protein